MKKIFNIGDKKKHYYIVKDTDIAAFEEGVVHRVCSTFALGREMEWSSRLFVLEMKEMHEEGIGTFLEIKHHSPALVGRKLSMEATLTGQSGNEVICDISVKSGERLVAEGKTGQKIVNREKLKDLFERLESEPEQ